MRLKYVEATATIQWREMSPDSFFYASPEYRRGGRGIQAHLTWDESERRWLCEIKIPKKRVHTELFGPTVTRARKRTARDIATEILMMIMIENLGG